MSHPVSLGHLHCYCPFSIFINDINTILKHSNCLLLADDTEIYKTIGRIDVVLILQNDLKCLHQLCNDK